MSLLNRRRFLAISAVGTVLPTGMIADVARWRGQALGAAVSMQLVGVEQAKADQIFALVEEELVRLEQIFSLYRDTSELSQLNRFGVLNDPSAELLHVLSTCSTLHSVSGGQFDPTIQPLWQAISQDQSAADLSAAQAKIGWSEVTFDAAKVQLSQGAALTLNGIAQGAITDRIAAKLKAQGLQDVLIDMGEVAAIGQGPNGPWSVGVAKPDGAIIHRLTARDRAVATSVPAAMLIGDGQDHILSPTGGRPVNALVSVSAPSAMIADGLSTALCLVEAEAAVTIVAGFSEAKIEVIEPL